MKKILFGSLILMLCITMGIGLFLSGCKTTTGTTTVETTAAETTVGETTAAAETTAEVNQKDMFTYDKLREMAKAGKYEGEPAKGHKIAFGQLIGGYPFMISVEEGIKKEWAAAGGLENDLLLLNNNVDIQTTLDNFDIVLNSGSEVFLEFAHDFNTNSMIGAKAAEAGLYIIAIDIVVPGFPFMGADNYKVGTLAGEWVAEKIPEIYGGIENVDRIYYIYTSTSGKETVIRVKGAENPLVEAFGDIAKAGAEGSIAQDIDTGVETNIQKVISDYFAKNSKDENVIVFTINDQAAADVKAAAELLGVWNPDKWTVMATGVDELGQQLIRDGVVDGDVAYFPETYGKYLIPGALAHIYGNPVPPYMYVDHLIITKDNIDQYYPSK